MNFKEFIGQLRKYLAEDKLNLVLQQLQTFLKNSPQLDQAILQTARYNDIRGQINTGIISHENANMEKNKIRKALIELLNEIEKSTKSPDLVLEIEQAIKIQPTIQQNAEKIYNINTIDKAKFS